MINFYYVFIQPAPDNDFFNLFKNDWKAKKFQIYKAQQLIKGKFNFKIPKFELHQAY